MKIVFIALTIAFVSAKFGFDASAGPFNVASMTCMKNNGFTFAIFRGYRSYGVVDPNVRTNVINANAGGIRDVDIYIYPCSKCGNPRSQVIATVKALAGAAYNRIWIDVERYGWDLNKKSFNRQFLAEMFDEATKHGKKSGIYTSSAEWGPIVGNDWTVGSKYSLWWARWDNKATLSNFQPFAGWRSCFMKQFESDRTACGVSYDRNFKN